MNRQISAKMDLKLKIRKSCFEIRVRLLLTINVVDGTCDLGVFIIVVKCGNKPECTIREQSILECIQMKRVDVSRMV